jgi:hypothetical protein
METDDLPRHQMIHRLLAAHQVNNAGTVIDLWEKMAHQLISIIGDIGFDSLYARSMSLAQLPSPWLSASSRPLQTDRRFAELRVNLDGQTSAQADAANSLLLITFTDILATMIGENLTGNILKLAWDDGAAGIAGKELKDE